MLTQEKVTGPLEEFIKTIEDVDLAVVFILALRNWTNPYLHPIYHPHRGR